jgi:hypothetical protein
MRLRTRSLLAAPALVAAIVIGPSTAGAQSVEVQDETNGPHCGAVALGAGHAVGGGCEVHVVSDPAQPFQTFSHNGTSEAVTFSCASEFNVNLGEAGTGYIDADDLTIATNPLAGCVITACDEAAPSHEELEWPIHSTTEPAAGIEQMRFTFCIRPFNTGEGIGNTPCTVTVDIVQADHEQELRADSEPCEQNPAREISGHWFSETLDEGDEVNVELAHQ